MENLFRLNNNKDNGIKNKMIRDMRTLFESDEEYYYEPVRTGNAFSGNNTEYESNEDKDKTLSKEEYLDKIRPYLSDMMNDHKTQGEWEIQLTIAINFLSSKDISETRTMHSNSDKLEIMTGNGTNEIAEEPFDSLLQKYQKGLEESMKGIEFVFDNVDLLYYKFHKVILNRGGSYIDSPKWFKKIRNRQ